MPPNYGWSLDCGAITATNICSGALSCTLAEWQWAADITAWLTCSLPYRLYRWSSPGRKHHFLLTTQPSQRNPEEASHTVTGQDLYIVLAGTGGTTCSDCGRLCAVVVQTSADLMKPWDGDRTRQSGILIIKPLVRQTSVPRMCWCWQSCHINAGFTWGSAFGRLSRARCSVLIFAPQRSEDICSHSHVNGFLMELFSGWRGYSLVTLVPYWYQWLSHTSFVLI